MITEIRDKTGLSQSQLALYLGVSRGMVNLVERGERELSGEAANKLSFLYLQLIQNEQKANKVNTKEKPLPSEKWKSQQTTFHNNRILEYEYKAAVLKRKISKMFNDFSKTNIRLNLLNNAGDNARKQIKKNNTDGLWFDTLHSLATSELDKISVDTQHGLEIEMNLMLGYADVHRSIIKKLGEIY